MQVVLPRVGWSYAACGRCRSHRGQDGLSNPANGCTRTFTYDNDFDEGTLINLNHDSPNNHQLQISNQVTPLPFVSVACSDRGTMVRIDSDTGDIVGEHMTAPEGRGKNSSRTTVDQLGNT